MFGFRLTVVYKISPSQHLFPRTTQWSSRLPQTCLGNIGDDPITVASPHDGLNCSRSHPVTLRSRIWRSSSKCHWLLGWLGGLSQSELLMILHHSKAVATHIPDMCVTTLAEALTNHSEPNLSTWMKDKIAMKQVSMPDPVSAMGSSNISRHQWFFSDPAGSLSPWGNRS